MAAYDSDSSLEDDPNYTETGVLLGYATKELTDDLVSHLGGRPVRLLPLYSHSCNQLNLA